VSWTDIPEWTLEVAQKIMESVKVKDPETYNHCIRVSKGSRLIAKSAGLNEIEQKMVEFAGLFHDVGKVGVPDHILLKPGKLTDDEFTVMKSHPEISVKILEPLASVEFYAKLIPGVMHHHERFDGKGYPVGVMGEEIPIYARMILIADTYDAMTSTRTYRKGLAPEVAYQELKDFAGRQFDARLVKIFIEAHATWRDADNKIFEEMKNSVLKAA
jgi:putative nucleotidyltransferase with HDIG domain